MTDEQLKSLCKLWQKRLRLQDWRVSARVVGSEEMRDALGDCTVYQDTKCAVIRVIDPKAIDSTHPYYSRFPENADIEKILLHEMLHILLDPFFDTDAGAFQETAQEQLMEQMATALHEGYSGERR